MTLYLDVVTAATETVGKILAHRGARQSGKLSVTTNGGHTASVTWGGRDHSVTVNLPSLPPDANMTRAEADQLLGYIAHECCHVIHSDWPTWQRAVRSGSRVAYWTNALEDVRIEHAEIRAGAYPNLRNLLSAIVDKHHFEALTTSRAKGRTIGASIADAPYCALVLGRMRNGYSVPTAGALQAGMAPDCAALVKHALSRIGRCRSTKAVLALALELVQLEAAQQPQQPQQPQPQQPQQPQPQQPQQPQQGDSEGDDGQGASQDAPGGDDGQGDAPEDDDGQGASQDAPGGDDGQGASQDAPEDDDGQGASQDAPEGDDGQGASQDAPEGDDGQGDAPEGDDGQGASQDAPEGEGEGEGEGDVGRSEPAASIDHDLTPMVGKVAARAGVDDVTEYAQESQAHHLSTARTVWEAPNYDTHTSPAARQDAARTMASRLPNNSLLHGQIGRLLVSEEVHRVTHHETSGRLDRRALVRMGTGALDVYSRRDDTPGINTALLILIDGSGSMSELAAPGQRGLDDRTDMAHTTAWHVGCAAEGAGAKVAVAGFHSLLAGGDPRRPVAANGVVLNLIKPWDATMLDRAVTLLNEKPDYWTPLAPAIVGAARLMEEVNATRRIMLVLTDGMCAYGNEGVTAACRIAADMGVEVVGIGMGCEEVTRAFPPRYSVNVTDLGQLSAKGLGVLVDMLEDANERGAD